MSIENDIVTRLEYRFTDKFPSDGQKIGFVREIRSFD
jgi:hypothetical protein